MKPEPAGPPALLRRSLPAGLRVDWLAECPSTNSALKARLAAAEPGGKAWLLGTEQQLAGRGTRGREWRQGGPGLDLALSLALRQGALPPGCPAADPRAPLLAAVLAARALEQSGLAVRLKWPNDLLLGAPPAKAGGLLCETSGGWLVIGLGLNVNSTAADFPGLPATTVRDALGRPADRAALARRLAQALCRLGWLDPAGPRPAAGELLADWPRLDATPGTPYRLLRGAGIPVQALRVDLPSGSLVCRDSRGAEHRVGSYTELAPDPGPR